MTKSHVCWQEGCFLQKIVFVAMVVSPTVGLGGNKISNCLLTFEDNRGHQGHSKLWRIWGWHDFKPLLWKLKEKKKAQRQEFCYCSTTELFIILKRILFKGNGCGAVPSISLVWRGRGREKGTTAYGMTTGTRHNSNCVVGVTSFDSQNSPVGAHFSIEAQSWGSCLWPQS